MSGLSRVGRTSYVLSTQRDEAVEERNIVDVAKDNDTEKLFELLRMGYNPNEQDGAGYTPLHWAARNNNIEVMQALIEAGASPYIKNCREFTPIREAALFSSRKAVRVLLGAYEIFNRRDARLPNAVERMDGIQLYSLFEEKVNPLSKNENGKTALEIAIEKQYRGIALAIIDYCEGKSHHLEEGPLHDAVRYNDGRALQMMLTEGANIEDRDVGLKTPLLLAATLNNTNAMGILLRAGADPNSTNIAGETALHLAVCSGKPEGVGLLLQSCAAVNAQAFKSKKTPLHYAKKFQPTLMPLLQKHGANRFILDSEGKDCQSHTEDSSCGSSVC